MLVGCGVVNSFFNDFHIKKCRNCVPSSDHKQKRLTFAGSRNQSSFAIKSDLHYTKAGNVFGWNATTAYSVSFPSVIIYSSARACSQWMSKGNFLINSVHEKQKSFKCLAIVENFLLVGSQFTLWRSIFIYVHSRLETDSITSTSLFIF